MYRELRIENYKAWNGRNRVRLAPITFLLGINSAGKSSLLHPLLLLKQTVEGADRRISLNLGGQDSDLVHVGTWDDVVSNGARVRRVGFGLDFETHLAKRREPVSFDASFDLDRQSVLRIRSLEYATARDKFSFQVNPGGGFRVDAKVNGTKVHKASRSRTFAAEGAVNFSPAARAALRKAGSRLGELSLELTSSLQSLQYLGPLREAPRRSYSWNGQMPTGVGTRGERTVQTLIAHLSQTGKKADALEDEFDRWIKHLGLADGLHVASDLRGEKLRPGTYEVHIERGKGLHEHTNIVDVGFGISQVLPVLTLVLTAPYGCTVIMEQPELHLHPLAQLGLTDLFVEVAKKRQLQIIAETHSEHMFRRLQTLIAADELSASDCALYYVDRSNDRSRLRWLEADDFGRLAEWPEGFFGDATGEMERQAEHRIRRMHVAKGRSRG